MERHMLRRERGFYKGEKAPHTSQHRLHERAHLWGDVGDTCAQPREHQIAWVRAASAPGVSLNRCDSLNLGLQAAGRKCFIARHHLDPLASHSADEAQPGWARANCIGGVGQG